MPFRSLGHGKGGKKRFPLGIPTSPCPEPRPSPDHLPRANMASQTDPLAEPATSTPGILEVMAAITFCHLALATCQTALTSKIEAVQIDVGLICQDLDKVRSHLTAAEVRVGHVEDTVAEHDGALRTPR